MVEISKIVPSASVPSGDAVNAFVPAVACVPLRQTASGTVVPLISAGDTVEEGQIIGRMKDGAETCLNAPVPGTVIGFKPFPGPDGKYTSSVCIRLHGAFSFLGKKQKKRGWELFSDTQICRIISDAGVINTFADPASLAAQITGLRSEKTDRILTVRLFDDDPSVVTDRYIALNHTSEIAEGIGVAAKAAGIDRVILAFYEEDAKILSGIAESEYLRELSCFCAAVQSKKYPSGSRSALIRECRRREANGGFTAPSPSDLFMDSSSVFNTYRAVVLGLPIMETLVYVGGGGLRETGMFSVKIGTPSGSLMNECGCGTKFPVEMVVNGLIKGTSAPSFAVPVTKATKSLHFLASKEVPDRSVHECIGCGKCRRVCPEHLVPYWLYEHMYRGSSANDSYAASSFLCSDCCLCNAVCPSRLPLYQAVCYLRDMLNEK